MRTLLMAVLVAAGCGAGNMTTAPDAATAPDAPQAANSCVDKQTTCAGESCCAVAELPGGSYFRGFDAAGAGSQTSPATVSAFRLDKYEITVGRFRAFVAAGMGTQDHAPADGSGAHSSIPGSGWRSAWNASLPLDSVSLVGGLKCSGATWTDAAGANEAMPLNCITWFEAMAFCAWDGGFLPTEAEWNFAAAGGSEQRAYPWSQPAADTTIDSTRAVYAAASTAMVPAGAKSAGVNRWGVSDLAGNVWEWTLDWNARYSTPCADCAVLEPAAGLPAYRVFRGGGWDSPAADLRTGNRGAGSPTYQVGFIGARCGR